MISCRQAQHIFDAFLDDELSPAMRAELHAHRLSCPDCSRELALLEACADVVRTDRREPTPHEDFADRVMVAFAGRRHMAVHPWRRIAVFAGSPLAAAAVLVFALMTWFRLPTHKTVTAGKAERLPPAIAADLTGNATRVMTPAEKRDFDRAQELPANVVLEALLSPVVERTYNTLNQTRRSASQLADFVRFGSEALLFAGQPPNTPPREGPDRTRETTWPEFDMHEPAGEHLDQPAPTDAQDDVEVM